MGHCRYWSWGHGSRNIRGQLIILLFPSPKRSLSLQDYRSLCPLFTMMLYKSLVPLVMAFVAASSVATSTVPVRRGGGGGYGYGLYPPPVSPPIPVNQCNSGEVQCCNTFTSQNNPAVTPLIGQLGSVVMNPATGVGMDCVGILAGAKW